MPPDQGWDATVAYLLTPEFTEVRELFEAVPEIGGVYFRLLESGVRVLDLHPDSPKPMVAVEPGSLIAPGTTASELAPTIPERVVHLRRTRAELAKPARDHRFEARLVRHALAHGLRLPRPFPPELRLLYSGWRVERPAGRRRQDPADLVAVDLASGRLVLVALRVGASSSAPAQVRARADQLHERQAALVPLFERVAAMMGELYGCYDLIELAVDPARVAGLVATEDARGEVTVTGVPAAAAATA
jgi:hypothetical protein